MKIKFELLPKIMKFSSPLSLLYVLLVFFISHAAMAQVNTEISGTILDKNIPVEFANVLLYEKADSTKLLSGIISDSTGFFKFDHIPPGEYILKINLIGYLPQSIPISLNTAHPQLNLNDIQLGTDSKLLESVVVTEQRDIVQKTDQGLIINAEATLTQAGGTVIDLLRNTPTVLIDADGGITLRGKTPNILINGRNSGIGDLSQIPASSVESIEIINNPTARYDADSEGGIINIKLKKMQQDGINGAFALGAGFGFKGRINGSFLLNYKSSKWNLGIAYDNRFAYRTRNVNGDRVNFNLPNEYALSQRRNDSRFEQNQNLRINIDYSPNAKNQIGLELIGNLSGQDNDESLKSVFQNNSGTFAIGNNRRSIEIIRPILAEMALNYVHKASRPGEVFTFQWSTSLNFNRENTDINTVGIKPNGSLTNISFDQRTHNYANTNISNLRLDYALPIGEHGTLEMGYKGILRLLNSDFQNASKVNADYVVNPKYSSMYDFKEQIHAVYAQYKGKIGSKDAFRWLYDFGLRVEQVWNEGLVKSTDQSFQNQYLNFFPTANLQYNLSQSASLKFSYSRRINRPGLGQLNPFIDITDSLTQSGGNPNLKPELINSFELGYSKDFSKLSFSSKIFYRSGINTILPFAELQSGGQILTRPQNAGSTETYGFESMISLQPGKFWNANLSISLYEQTVHASNLVTGLVNNVFNWNGKLINNFNLWAGASFQIIGVYNAPVATIQGQRIAGYNIDMAFQQKVLKSKGRIGLIVTDVFNTLKSGNIWNTTDFNFTRTSKVDTRAVLFTFAYTFGTTFKDKLMDNKFSND